MQQQKQQQPLSNLEIKKLMNPLTQETLETLLQQLDPSPLVIIYFTASWCGPCNRLNLDTITRIRPGIQWYLCDVDENDYSLGYCGGSSIPSWLAIKNGKALPLFSHSNTDRVCEWISKL